MFQKWDVCTRNLFFSLYSILMLLLIGSLMRRVNVVFCNKICAYKAGTMGWSDLMSDGAFILFALVSIIILICGIVHCWKRGGSLTIWQYFYKHSVFYFIPIISCIGLLTVISSYKLFESETVMTVVLIPVLVGVGSSVTGSILYGKFIEAKELLKQKNNPKSPKSDSDIPDNPSSTHSEEKGESISIEIDKNTSDIIVENDKHRITITMK